MSADARRSPPARAATVLYVLAALVVVVAGMRAAQPIIVPFLLSVFIAILSAPPLVWLERHGLHRALAMLVVVAGIIAAGFLLTLLVGGSLQEFSRDIPEYRARMGDRTGVLIDWLQAKGVAVSRADVMSRFDPGAALQMVGDVLNGFKGVLANAFLIFLMVVFILFEAASFPDKLRAIVADPERSLDRFQVFSANVQRYLAIKTAASLGTGLALGLWLWILGVKYPVLWALLAFLLNFVPNIGSVIAAVPAVLFATIQAGPAAAGWAALGYVAVNVLVGSVIEPRYMGRGLGLSALVVFLSLVFWGWALGPVGMFLSVPLTMTVRIALASRPDTHWVAVLLGPGGAAADAPEART